MKHLKYFYPFFWLTLAAGLLFSLAGCGTPAVTPVPTTVPVQNTPTAQKPATIRGIITYQAPPTATSMLYFIGPERWYSMEVPGASPYSTFEMQVAPGTYQLVAYPVGSETEQFRPAAAYSTGSGIATLTVAAGQTVEGIHVQNINSDNCVTLHVPCLAGSAFPAPGGNLQQAPDGNSAGYDPRDHQLPGSAHPGLHPVFHQSGQSEFMYPLEVPAGNPVAMFELKVAPGTYQLIAFPVGSENLANRPAAAYTTGSGIAALTVAAGQVVENIHVQNINSDRCVNYAFPASPDGLFPPIEENCSKLSSEPAPATVRGTISYQAPPAPTSMLYFISGEHWYVQEVPGGNPMASFEQQVAPGTYQVVAFPSGVRPGRTAPPRPIRPGPGLGALTVGAGQTVDGIQVQNINSDRCMNYPFPASPDGRFPPIEENCSKLSVETAPATIAGTITYQAPPSPASILYAISAERWYSHGSRIWKPVFDLQIAGGSRHLPAGCLPGRERNPGRPSRRRLFDRDPGSAH